MGTITAVVGDHEPDTEQDNVKDDGKDEQEVNEPNKRLSEFHGFGQL
jgi:hypothetical protein